MARVLVTGMSGAGKSTLLAELARRGHTTIDTDHGGWVTAGGSWDEPRLRGVLTSTDDVAPPLSSEPRSRTTSTRSNRCCEQVRTSNWTAADLSPNSPT